MMFNVFFFNMYACAKIFDLGFHVNTIIMALPRVSAHLPFYDPSKSSLAFGDRALPKLVRPLPLAILQCYDSI